MAQLVHTQRFMAFYALLVQLQLKLKCLACHVCLEFLFDKNRYYESVWDWYFYYLMRRFGKFYHFAENDFFLKQPSTNFQKNGIYRKITSFLVCLHALRSFLLIVLSISFEKVCWKCQFSDLLTVFLDFS